MTYHVFMVEHKGRGQGRLMNVIRVVFLQGIDGFADNLLHMAIFLLLFSHFQVVMVLDKKCISCYMYYYTFPRTNVECRFTKYVTISVAITLYFVYIGYYYTTSCRIRHCLQSVLAYVLV